MLKKFQSRKFITGAAAFVALLLATTGVIDEGTEVQLAQALTVAVYVVVQGIIDLSNS